ncbi:MAG: hypothetical protein ACOVP1_04975 [Bacteroidia bacterium]
MSLHTFWVFVLKIMGLYLVVQSIVLLPQSILILYSNSLFENPLMAISIVLMIVLAFYLLIRFLVFNPNIIIAKLKLDKGFQEEKIQIELHSKQLIQVCTIILGAIQFVDSFPEFCREVYLYVQSKETMLSDPSTEYILVNGLHVLFAYLLLSRSKDISDYIDSKSNLNNENKTEH